MQYFIPAMQFCLDSHPLLSQCLPSTTLIPWQWWSVLITRKWSCLCKQFVYREDICVKNGYQMIYYHHKFLVYWYEKCCNVDEFVIISCSRSEVVKMTTSGTANDNKFINVTTLLFQCSDGMILLCRSFNLLIYMSMDCFSYCWHFTYYRCIWVWVVSEESLCPIPGKHIGFFSNQIKSTLLSYWDKVKYTAITNSTHCHMSYQTNSVWHNTKYRSRITKLECSDLTLRDISTKTFTDKHKLLPVWQREQETAMSLWAYCYSFLPNLRCIDIMGDNFQRFPWKKTFLPWKVTPVRIDNNNSSVV